MAKIQVGKLNISIKKRTLPQFLMLYVFALPLLFSFLLDFLEVASIVKYTVDACWVLTVVLIDANFISNITGKHMMRFAQKKDLLIMRRRND